MTIEKIRKEHELIDLFCNLAEVPSPSMHEEKVAQWIKMVQNQQILLKN